jgi:hypothetical protein
MVKYTIVAGNARTRVGERPLHKDEIPSTLTIFTNASCS